eukprot:gene7157-266_t
MNKKHGRRSAVPETSSHANNDNVFILGLKPPDEKNFHPSVEVVQSEYAHRFLEQLGVKPTNKTLEMVHKSVPLTDKCLKANLRAKGHVEDELHITVPHVKHDFKVPTIADPIEILQLGMFNASKATAAAGASSASDRVMSGESMEVKEPAGSLFKRLASSYIYPLNLDAGIAKERLDRFAEITKAKLRTQDVDPVNSVHCVEKEGSGGGSAVLHVDVVAEITIAKLMAQDVDPVNSVHCVEKKGRGGRTSFSLVRQTTLQHSLMGASHEKKDVGIDMDMAEELLRNLNVTTEIILTVLSQLESTLTDWYKNLNVTPEIVLTVLSQLESALTDWYKAQAPETLKGRLSHQEFVDTLELISCDNGMQFYITCINFMYEEYVRGSPSYPHHLESKVTHPPPHPTHEKKKRGSLIAGSILTKGQALQKYDNGYALFVKSRMKDRNDAQARLASGRKTGRNTATARFSSIPIGPQSKDAAASSTATYRAGLVIDMSRRGDLNHTSSNHSKVVFKEQGGSVRSERRPGGFASSVSFAVKPGSGGESRPASAAGAGTGTAAATALGTAADAKGTETLAGSGLRLQEGPIRLHSFCTLVLPFTLPPSLIFDFTPSDSDSKDPLDSTEDHMRLISASPSVRRSMRHLVSFSSAVSATQSMIVLKGMKAGDLKELQQARLFSLQQEFAEIYQEQRATRAEFA